jgi:hypothetical protein
MGPDRHHASGYPSRDDSERLCGSPRLANVCIDDVCYSTTATAEQGRATRSMVSVLPADNCRDSFVG